jgi:hypothetical protein
MKIQVREGHAGVMVLKDGTKMNYGVIRVTRNMSKMVYYTGKGLREMFKPDMNEEEKSRATELKKLDEKTLMWLGYIAEIPFENILTLNSGS